MYRLVQRLVLRAFDEGGRAALQLSVNSIAFGLFLLLAGVLSP